MSDDLELAKRFVTECLGWRSAEEMRFFTPDSDINAYSWVGLCKGDISLEEMLEIEKNAPPRIFPDALGNIRGLRHRPIYFRRTESVLPVVTRWLKKHGYSMDIHFSSVEGGTTWCVDISCGDRADDDDLCMALMKACIGAAEKLND